MNIILTIFRKELKDVLRDRRTIITMVAIPLILFPVIFGLMSKISSVQMQKAQDKKLRIAYVTNGNETELTGILQTKKDMKLLTDIPADSIELKIRNEEIDAGIVVDGAFNQRFEALKAGRISVYYRSTSDESITFRRVKSVIDEFEQALRTERFNRLSLDENVVNVLRLDRNDVASAKEKFGKMAGGFLPYIFVLFCFMGAMYPAIDLAAGEKERGTIETLLTSPASRFQILIGKFIVVFLSGMISAGVSILGLYIGISSTANIPVEVLNILHGLLEPVPVLLLLSLLIPLTIFFASILLSLSIFAKNFKEAQSLITPGNILVIVPAAIGMIPGITLNYATAFIPVLNVSLATKEILAGTLQYDLLAMVYISLIVLAVVSLWLCSHWFGREETIFRE